MPTLPALAAMRRRADLAGAPIASGARPSIGILPLGAIEAKMARHRIATGVVVQHPEPLFMRALNPGFAAMPKPIRALHDTLVRAGRHGSSVANGLAVAHIAALLGLPAAMESWPVRVAILPDDYGRERWFGGFGTRAFSIRMSVVPEGEGRDRLREHFNPFAMELVVRAHDQGLDMEVTGWRLGLIPLPCALCPTTQASERLDAKIGFFRCGTSPAFHRPASGLHRLA